MFFKNFPSIFGYKDQIYMHVKHTVSTGSNIACILMDLMHLANIEVFKGYKFKLKTTTEIERWLYSNIGLHVKVSFHLVGRNKVEK